MNNLQKALAQIVVLLRSMSLQLRMIAAVLLVLIVVSGSYLANVGVSGDRVLLLGDASIAPNELISMRLAFAKAGLNDFAVEGDRILVPRAQQSQYLAAIADADALPHNFGDAMRKMLENTSPFIDRKRREEMQKVAVQEYLSRTIMAMGYVEWATVMYDVQQQTFPQNKRDVRVCVTVKPLAKSGLTLEQARKIRSVVGPSLSISPNEVTLVPVHGPDYPAGTDNGASGSGHELYATTQHAYEQQYKEKIRAALHFVPDAVVTVNVELHSEVEDSSQSVKIDAKAAPSDRSEQNHNLQAPAKLHGVQKFEFGGANTPAVIDITGAEGYETRHVKRAGLTPKRVTVSVAVPGEYYAQVWRDQNGNSFEIKPTAAQLAPLEQEIRKKIEQHVAGVMPTQEANSELTSLVTVTAFPPTRKAEQLEISRAELVLAWLNEHSTLVAAAVSCLLGLLILRSIVRSVTRRAAAEPMADVDGEEELDELPRRAVSSPAGRRRSLRRAAMRDELHDFVRDDPGAAANVLRTWIGSAN
jgi:flagellar M-ring protein FliF